MTDLGSILITGSLTTVGSGIGVLILVIGASKIGRYLAHCRQTQTAMVIPESVDEQFEFAGHPNYAALRNRTSQLRADEAARAV